MTHAYLYFLSLLAARTVVITVATVVGLRLLGKRQIGQVNLYDLAMIMLLANAVQNAMTTGAGDLSAGLVCAATLLLLGRLATACFIRLPRVEQNLCGTPSVLINEGKIVESHLRRECVTHAQLNSALRSHGLIDAKYVRMAVLEVDGSLSIVPFEQGDARAEDDPYAGQPKS